MSDYELVVIGGGEAGISAALRATQLGARVCMINRESELGGGCVQTGTLPSKTLSNAAHFLENLKKGKRYGIPVVEGAKADYKTILESRHKTTMCEVGILATLIRKNAIETLTGTASFKGPRSVKGRAFGSPLARGLYPRASTAEVDPRVKPGAGLPSPGPGKAGAPAAVEVRLLDGTVRALEAPKTVIATGSRPVALPGLPFDGKTVLSPDDLTALDAVPGRFLIVGAGVIGCEMAFIFRSLGSEVVVVEKAERALLGQDHDVATLITREFKKRGIRLLVQTGLERVETAADGHVRAFLAGAETVEADRVMVAVGRRPNTEEPNLAAAGITPGPRGEIQVDERMETTVPGIYAAGDVLARFMLSSMAVVEARIAAENAMGRAVKMDYTCAPWGIYTDPEVGSVGLTEEWARAGGGDIVIGQCGYNDLVRSCLDGNVTGFFKLIFDGPTRRLIGAHVAGQDASEIIHFAALAIKMGARAEDLKDMVYNHPTVSEGFGKAAADALKKFEQRTPA